MKKIALTLLFASCARHPVATVAVGAGSIGLLTCEANSASLWRSHDTAHVQATCGIFTAGAALFLGGLAAVVTHFANAEPTAPPPDEHMLPSGAVRVHGRAEPPPVPVGSGVEPAPPQSSGALGAPGAPAAEDAAKLVPSDDHGKSHPEGDAGKSLPTDGPGPN